ncbi:MAG: tail fiber domain-containing protein, partial [Sediminibacterium sp.]
DYASRYLQYNSQHIWYTAPSGTAGNAISFTQAMTLNASGNLSVGNTNDTYKLDVSGTGRFGASQVDILLNATSTSQYSRLVFQENGTEKGGIEYINSAFGTTARRNKLEIFNSGGINFVTTGNFSAPDFSLSSTGAATFSSSVGIGGATNTLGFLEVWKSGSSIAQFSIGQNATYHTDFFIDATGNFYIQPQGTTRLTIASTGAATFSSSVSLTSGYLSVDGFGNKDTNYITMRSGFAPSDSGGIGFKAIDHSGSGTDGLACYGHDGISFYTAQSPRITITSGGNLLVGDTSNASGSPTFYVKNKNGAVANIAGWNFGGTTTADNGNNNLLSSGAYYNGANLIATQTSATNYQQYNGEHYFYGNVGLTAGNSFTNTERMRISSNGQLTSTCDASGTNSQIFFNSNTSSPYGPWFRFNVDSNNATNYYWVASATTPGETVRAKLFSNGGLSNYQANDTNLSDIRTKKDITPLGSYWDKFKAIEMVKFKYKDQTHDDFNIGVIAQQVEKVAPEFVDVDGWGDTPKDGVPLKSIYTADLHHATIKVLQEAMAKIEDLQNQLDTLKNK